LQDNLVVVWLGCGGCGHGTPDDSITRLMTPFSPSRTVFGFDDFHPYWQKTMTFFLLQFFSKQSN